MPPGNSDWTNTLSLGAVALGGAGVGSTIISNSAANGTPLVHWTLVTNQPSRMSGIEFRRGSLGPNFWQHTQIDGLNTDSRTMRIDHCQYTTLQEGALLVYSTLGVFDHNTVITEGTPAWLGYVKGNGWGGVAYGDQAYVEGEQFGSDKFFFFEDNILTNRAASHITMLDCQAGGRYVWRHNKVYKGSMESHGLEAQRERSGRAFEFMDTPQLLKSNCFTTGCGMPWRNRSAGRMADAPGIPTQRPIRL
jgi:hypothetical protein